MGQPANRVAFAAARRVLNQVVVARALRPRIGFEFAHHVKLMIARKDQRFALHLLAVLNALDDLQMQEARQDVHEAVARPDLLPQVGRFVAAWIIGIARARAVTQVEGQEVRGPARQLRRHRHFIGIDGEVDERAFLELKDQFARIAIGWY